MPVLTVEKGGPDIDDGTYSVTLLKVEGPKTIYPQQGPNTGKAVDIYDWTFEVDGAGDEPVELQATTSPALSPKSKMYAFVTALAGGRPPAVGAVVDTDKLVGRKALASISRPADGGWPRIASLTAMPASMLQQQFAEATGAPTRGRKAAEPAPAPADDLPF